MHSLVHWSIGQSAPLMSIITKALITSYIILLAYAWGHSKS